MEYICPNCDRLQDLLPGQQSLENKKLKVKSRWGVRDIKVVLGNSSHLDCGPYDSEKVHLMVDVVGVSIPDQKYKFLNKEAEEYGVEYLSEGIRACTLIDLNK